MVVAKYPATYGHTTVINHLCNGLNKMGYRAAIGAFSFDKKPPFDIEAVKLSKFKLLTHGDKYLDFDIIHSHQSRVNYYLLSVKPTKPFVLHYHGASSKIQEINFKIMMFLYKNKISKIIAVSRTGISQMKKMIGDVRAEVIYNGVDTEFYNVGLPTPYKKGNPQLLFVSSLRRYKRANVLIEIMPQLLQKYPEAHLQIVGNGEEFHVLKNMVQNKNLGEKIELTGQIQDDELRLRYASCDLYVSASTFEVCPVPTLEAMSCGKSLVLFDIESHREIIDESKAGLIFSLNDMDILSKIEDALKNKPHYEMAARKFAEDNNWQSVCNRLVQAYKNIEK